MRIVATYVVVSRPQDVVVDCTLVPEPQLAYAVVMPSYEHAECHEPLPWQVVVEMSELGLVVLIYEIRCEEVMIGGHMIVVHVVIVTTVVAFCAAEDTIVFVDLGVPFRSSDKQYGTRLFIARAMKS